mmetsp:Transcript_15682/g.23758  ORF Transcript_15682/g.23758 Transcript_15682/m.23758 type:complete len:90 (-) Transcript_15682:44-313(-)
MEEEKMEVLIFLQRYPFLFEERSFFGNFGSFLHIPRYNFVVLVSILCSLVHDFMNESELSSFPFVTTNFSSRIFSFAHNSMKISNQYSS